MKNNCLISTGRTMLKNILENVLDANDGIFPGLNTEERKSAFLDITVQAMEEIESVSHVSKTRKT